MRNQLLTLQQLIAVMDPELYRHLGKLTSLPLRYFNPDELCRKD